MHFEYAVFDAHCDTPDKWMQNDRACAFDFESATQYKQYIQVLAVWIDGKKVTHPNAYTKDALSLIRKKCGRIPIIKTSKDIDRKEIAVLLGVEGGEALEGKLENLQILYNQGVRLMTLTWNWPNEIGEPAITRENIGLTAFGKQVVCEMNRLGMAVDVSHLSERGFWDVLEITQKPIIASHSSAKAICSHDRNLTDMQFAALVKNDGVVGINFYPQFLGGNDIEDILRHILHFMELGGENHIGFGSDFDGVDVLPSGMRGNADIYKIIDIMLRHNIREDIVRKVAFENMKRYFTAVLPFA